MSIFLKAEWRKLVMANYAIDQQLVNKFLPHKTEIDLWNNTCYVSLVGFMFLNTAVKGIKLPFHSNFEEVNLRFYVRYKDGNAWKRGVVFVKEIVPRPLLTFVANTIYKEHYETMPMSHSWETKADTLEVAYNWKKGNWHTLKVRTDSNAHTIPEGSEEEFITEHYWGYTFLNSQSTAEYGVEHPRWQVYDVKDYTIDVDFGNVYGPEFGFLSKETPQSVFLAEGSEIVVKVGRTI